MQMAEGVDGCYCYAKARRNIFVMTMLLLNGFLPQYVETELNKKKVIYLSKGNASHFLCFLWHKFCKQMCVRQMSPFIQIHPNDGIIYCAFLIE